MFPLWLVPGNSQRSPERVEILVVGLEVSVRLAPHDMEEDLLHDMDLDLVHDMDLDMLHMTWRRISKISFKGMMQTLSG